MISLSATTPLTLRGIYDLTSTTQNYNIYFNSIYIGGAVTGLSNSEAYYRFVASITDLRNNIFVNARTGGTGKHYAIRTTTSVTSLTSDYNDIYSTGGTANVFGNDGTADRADLTEWQMATAKDANSISADPLFVSSTDLHILTGSPANNVGIPIAGVTIDFDFQFRDATPDIGADEILGPSAAGVSVSGRVVTAGGNGIRNAMVTVTGNNLPEQIVTYTGSFGIYNFNDLPAGETYVITVNSRRFFFSVPSRIVSLTTNLTDVDFIAEPQ